MGRRVPGTRLRIDDNTVLLLRHFPLVLDDVDVDAAVRTLLLFATTIAIIAH